MSSNHPIVNGLDAISSTYRQRSDYTGIFEAIYDQIRDNWRRRRDADRWPSQSNWVLRVAPNYTPDPRLRLEKQLQKQIAICLEHLGWGNDIPTAAGLIDSGGRHMNVDLGHQIARGFELIEVKVAADSPYDAAFQILRYGALYMLYRLEPELARRTRNAVTTSSEIVLEVLAPYSYYHASDVNLRELERQFHREVVAFAERCHAPVALSFRFMAFPPDFTYRPGMDCATLKDAVLRRASPFSWDNAAPAAAGPLSIEGVSDEWTAGELGRSWMSSGSPAVPAEVAALLDSHEGTRGTVIESGIADGGLTLRARRDSGAVTVRVVTPTVQLPDAIAYTVRQSREQNADFAILLLQGFDADVVNGFLSVFYPANGGPDEPVDLHPGEVLGPISVDDLPLFIGRLNVE